MQGTENAVATASKRLPWNKGKLNSPAAAQSVATILASKTCRPESLSGPRHR
jgi:hypothetical protein